MNQVAEQIKSTLPMQQVVESYGLEVNRGGYILCPLHSEKSPSLKLYDDDRGWYCFGCQTGGDVINFVEHYFELDFKAAMVKLNYDFNLRLPLGERQTARERARAKRRVRELQRQREATEAVRKYKEQRYWALMDDWITSDINSREYAPKTPGEEFHPLFVEALKQKDYQSYLIDLYT